MAYWIEHEHLFAPKRYECSSCGNEFDAPYAECPKCGSDMSGKGGYEPDYIEECFVMDMFTDF